MYMSIGKCGSKTVSSVFLNISTVSGVCVCTYIYEYMCISRVCLLPQEVIDGNPLCAARIGTAGRHRLS